MKPVYTVKAVKTFRGHDGYGYSCNLLKDGKKVAEVVEDGWGGGLQFHWKDNKTTATVKTRTYDDKEHSFQGTVEESVFYEYVMSLPKIPTHDELDTMFTSPDIVIDDMVNDSIAFKKVASDMKKKITIQDTDGKFLVWKITSEHTAEIIKAHILKKYPSGKILNELPTDEVVSIFKKAKLV